MIPFLLALLGVMLLVMAGEYLRRVHLLHTEVTRKFIHISVAAFAATWPSFLEWRQIILISLMMFVGIVLSRGMHLFRAIHGVQRRTWGEVFFAMSIGIVAVLAEDPWAFAAAMLVMGVADGFAALAGTLFHGRRYHVFGHAKSVHGTATFTVMTLLILFVSVAAGDLSVSFAGILFLTAISAALENVSVAGTDNFFVPLAVILGINMF